MPPRAAPVVVIDLQTGMFDGVLEPPLHDSAALLERVGAVLDWARRTGRPVAFIRHDGPEGDPLAPGQPGWPVWPALGQAPGEVVLLGAQSDHCVAATVKGAMAAGLDVTVVSDAHGTWPTASETAPQIIARHNAEFAQAGAILTLAAALVAGNP